jgi:hypothetical protein
MVARDSSADRPRAVALLPLSRSLLFPLSRSLLFDPTREYPMDRPSQRSKAKRVGDGMWDDRAGEAIPGAHDDGPTWEISAVAGADGSLQPGAEVAGEIAELDPVLHTVTLAGGEVYAVDEEFNMGGFARGERVRLTPGINGVIRAMTPEPTQ